MPPGSDSRSTTTTRPAPAELSAAAAARPAGPPPMTATSTRSTCVSEPANVPSRVLGEQRGDRRPAEETLTAAHEHPRTAPEAVEVDRGHSALRGVADLPPGHALAEAGDRPVLAVGRDSRRIGIWAQLPLADARHPQGGEPLRPLAQRQAGGVELVPNVLGDRQRAREPGGADTACA